MATATVPRSATSTTFNVAVWLILLLTVTLALTLLFVLGVKQQERLQRAHIEQVFQSLSNIEKNVAVSIDRGLMQTAQSAARFASTINEALSDIPLPVQQAHLHRFEQHMELRSDNTWRNRPPFDGRHNTGVVIPNYVRVDRDIKIAFSALQQVNQAYGRGAQQTIFVNSWILPIVGGETIYWPDFPNFAESAEPAFDYRDTEWVSAVNPSNNPNRSVRWTAMSFDPTPKIWMMSAVAPIFRDGQWFGSAGHDVPLDKLIESTRDLQHTAGAEFMLLNADGLVLASDRFAEDIIQSEGKLRIEQIVDQHWPALWQQAQQRWQDPATASHIQFSDASHNVFASRIISQNWYLIQRVPTSPIVTPVIETFTHLRNIALTAFLIEVLVSVALIIWIYHRQHRFVLQETQSRQELIKSEKRFRDLVANVPGIVYRCANDENWSMHFISDEVKTITGYGADDFIANRQRSFSSVIDESDRQRVADTVDAALQKRQSWSIEYRLQHADGHTTWVHERGMGVYDDEEKLLYLDGVIIDVNQQKLHEQALKQLNEELENRVTQRTAALQASIAELETFSYSVSHDLRAPLRHIMSYLTILRDEMGETATTHEELLNRIDNAGNRMNALISGLLTLSRVDRKGMQITKVDLNELIEKVKPELPDMPIAWSVETLGVIEGDLRLLQQVFANLLANAIKYSARNPFIKIDISRHPELAQSGEIVFCVRDNGVGFSTSDQHKLFKVFQRLHSASEFSGEGIGLAITQKIVTLHRGRIWASSVEGQGASFFVALPKQFDQSDSLSGKS